MSGRLGKYQLLDELGAGGMAVVYRAQDTILSRTVALKVINQRLHSGEGARRRFLNEARVVAALSHPNIISIYELGVEDGFPFIAMEYLPGRDLRDLLDERETLTIRQKVGIALQIARALQHAHSRGVIHRDVKPANIRVLDSGIVKLMDFGIAKFLEEESSRLTRTGAVVGSTPYLSPEQLQGDEPSEASDAFAFGIVLYELLTFTRPFNAANPAAIVYRILHVEAPHLSDPDIPDKLKLLVEACLKKPVAERLTSFSSIVQQLVELRDELRLSGASAGTWSEAVLTDEGVVTITPDPSIAPSTPKKPVLWRNQHQLAGTEPGLEDEDPPTEEASLGRTLVVSTLVFVLGGLSVLVIGLGIVWMGRWPGRGPNAEPTSLPTVVRMVPTVARTPSPTATLPATRTPTSTSSPTISPTLSAVPSATASATRTREPSVTATSKKPTASPKPTLTETPRKPTEKPTNTSVPATQTPTSTRTLAPKPSSTPTLKPLASATPRLVPEPLERNFLEQRKPRGNELEYYERAKSLIERERWSEAESNLLKALEENPQPAVLMEGMFPIRYLPQLLLAKVYANQGDLAKARRFLREARRHRLEPKELAEVERLLEP